MKLRNWISVAPYRPDGAFNEDGAYGSENETNYCRVLGLSFEADKTVASFAAMIDTDGQVMDFLRLKYLFFNSRRNEDCEKKVSGFVAIS